LIYLEQQASSSDDWSNYNVSICWLSHFHGSHPLKTPTNSLAEAEAFGMRVKQTRRGFLSLDSIYGCFSGLDCCTESESRERARSKAPQETPRGLCPFVCTGRIKLLVERKNRTSQRGHGNDKDIEKSLAIAYEVP
jgi:hypothetical protein